MANDNSVAIQAAIGRHQAGDLHAAEQMYRNILSKTPNDAGIANLLGVALFQQNKLQEAEAEICHAIKLNPLEAAFHFNLGSTAKALGRTKQAEGSYSNALKLKPYYPEATQNLCNLLEAQERYEAAAQLCRDAIRLNPRDLNAHTRLVRLLEKQGDWANAVAFYPQILALQPNNPVVRSAYAQALQNYSAGLLEAGQCTASDSVYWQALKIDPTGLSALQILIANESCNTRQASPGCMRELFDGHADKLEQHFQPRMGCDIPEKSYGLLTQQDSRIGDELALPGRSGENVRTEQAVREILSDRYANDASIQGWLFAALIDHRFIDNGISRHPVRRRTIHAQVCPESADVDQAASDHLARICQIGDIAAQYSALEHLTLLNTPSLTQDSFAGLTEIQARQAIHQFFSGGRLNLVIIGAGPVGLLLASALKLALNKDVNVLVIENRVSSPHHKLPYERHWITNVPSTSLQELVEESLRGIFARIGDGAYIGCTINVLESLLLLSCRRLGVRFLFAESCDFSFIQDGAAQIVFDATGNRFQPISRPHSTDQITLRHNVETNLFGITDATISRLGIKIHSCADNRHITVGTYNNLIFPLHKNQPVKLAMLKLIHIPIRFYGALMRYITQHNVDNKYYVWPGTLRAEINQLIVIINLDKAEYDYLCKHHVFPMNLTEALQIEAFGASLDERTGAILKLLAGHANEHEQIGIDAPFLFEPYLVNRAQPEYLYGRPLLHIGDSIYNGNVKCGNGLGSHLRHVRHIQKTLQKYAR